jgi:hypothetical protein
MFHSYNDFCCLLTAFKTFEDCALHHSFALKLKWERNLIWGEKKRVSQNYVRVLGIFYVCRKLIFEIDSQLKERVVSYILLQKALFRSSQVYSLQEIAQTRHDAI